eukprot:4194205-Amphidinium_carterae.2
MGKRVSTCGERRIGEAKQPGPTICSVNPRGWSRVTGTLALKLDIVAPQETFLLRDAVSSAHYTASPHGYYSSFTLPGKPVGDLVEDLPYSANP